MRPPGKDIRELVGVKEGNEWITRWSTANKLVGKADPMIKKLCWGCGEYDMADKRLRCQSSPPSSTFRKLMLVLARRHGVSHGGLLLGQVSAHSLARAQARVHAEEEEGVSVTRDTCTRTLPP